MTEPYARGPGRVPRPGPVEAAYADSGALERDCPDCGQPKNAYCVGVKGLLRKLPCYGRQRKDGK